ncbi:arsenate reductase ArsC [Gilvimarinus sp. 1_MG-2023]|uniref:arsenate reductase ArsC n=1 Tax=Gilvimarinus sp. 1_MG-2023 TaxID=3062638 RepID=UPI0026E168A8|nr:arsenate reductase ArsC [Gilvimarinus sp. 1_MG-2023]MDO6746602.1 arsenate reductase ArsC [Gilvimarinus sp. 1_MG-2023]
MKILFVCTHNACRSVLAEVTANRLGAGRITATSAGSAPAGRVHPLTLNYLSSRNIATEGLKSQGMDEFEDFAPDLVITVCDRAAGEACPLWLGDTAKAHWGLPDPSHAGLEGDDALEQAFDAVVDVLQRRIQALLDANGDSLLGDSLQALAAQVAEQEPYRE